MPHRGRTLTPHITMRKRTVMLITGPTASGKSALAIDLALQSGTEIVSADSRQTYRHIPILTAVPTAEERMGIRHHLMEELELEDYYSASMFESEAMARLADIFSRNDVAVVCGGSMMYIDALCHGIDDIPTVPAHIREATVHDYETKGTDWLREELHRLDPDYFATVDLHNIKRLLHAVEIIRTAGVTYSSLRTGAKRARPFAIEEHRLMPPREELFSRINSRVDAMMAAGALDEARSMYDRRHLNSLNTVGFKELFAYFDGLMSLDEAVARIKKNTRVYAKKQMLWAKKRIPG